jgi:hypothetical protein
MPTPDKEFCGIDPDAMEAMSRSLRDGMDRLTAFHRAFEHQFRAHDVSTSPLRELLDVSQWGRSQISMLAYRTDTIRQLGKGAGQAFLRLPDELAAIEDARGLAAMYGSDILAKGSGDLQAQLIHEHADEVAALADNPQAAAAFFALLPPGVRNSLPSLIADSGGKTARQDLAAFSEALGAALRAPTALPAFAAFKADFLKPDGKVAAWERLALLKGAGAPASYRSAAARALALDDFVANPRQDFRAATPHTTKALGYPSDVVAMALEVLDGDGVAARDAFAHMGSPAVELTQAAKMRLFIDYAKGSGTGDEVADAFGRVLVAGAEATTQTPGEHSPEAASFAFDAITTTASFGENLPRTAMDSMTVLAKSYVHELTSGGRFDKAIDRSSTMARPSAWRDRLGVTPAFYLSPGDTYGFLRTFVGDERLSGDFDAVMARFHHDTLVAAARTDAKDGTDSFEDLTMMFGDFGGLAFKAASTVRSEADATDEFIRNIAKNTLSMGIDVIPVGGGGSAVAERAIEGAWAIAKAHGASNLLDDWNESFTTRVERLSAQHVDLVGRQKYDMTQFLHEGGFPATAPPPEIVDPKTGRLKTYDEILADAKRDAAGDDPSRALKERLTVYERWMDSNDRLDKKAEFGSRLTTNEQARQLIETWK